MKKILKLTLVVALTVVMMTNTVVPTYAGVKNTKTGPVFTVSENDTVMTASIKTNQKMSIKNAMKYDLELILDGVYQGYVAPGTVGSLTSTSDRDLTAAHQVLNGIHYINVVSSVPQSILQIQAIDTQINQLCAMYQNALNTGDTALQAQCIQLVQILLAQKAELQK